MKKATFKTVEQLRGALESAGTIRAVEAVLYESSAKALRSYAKQENYYFGKPLTKVTKDELIRAILGSVCAELEVEPEVKTKAEEEKYKYDPEVFFIREQAFNEKMRLFEVAVKRHKDDAFTVLRKYFSFTEIYRVAGIMKVPDLERIQDSEQYRQLLSMMRAHYETWESMRITTVM